MTGVILITRHLKTTDQALSCTQGLFGPREGDRQLGNVSVERKENNENRRNWRYRAHWIEACQKASRRRARGRGRIAQYRRQQRYWRGTGGCAEGRVRGC